MSENKTDSELCEEYPNIEPEFTRSREIVEKVMLKFQAEHFKPLTKIIADHVTEHLWDLFRDHLLSDTELNLEGHMRHRIDTSVKALLGGEQWVVDKYIMDKYGSGQRIRKALAELIPTEIMDARIADMAAEIAVLKDDLRYERARR